MKSTMSSSMITLLLLITLAILLKSVNGEPVSLQQTMKKCAEMAPFGVETDFLYCGHFPENCYSYEARHSFESCEFLVTVEKFEMNCPKHNLENAYKQILCENKDITYLITMFRTLVPGADRSCNQETIFFGKKGRECRMREFVAISFSSNDSATVEDDDIWFVCSMDSHHITAWTLKGTVPVMKPKNNRWKYMNHYERKVFEESAPGIYWENFEKRVHPEWNDYVCQFVLATPNTGLKWVNESTKDFLPRPKERIYYIDRDTPLYVKAMRGFVNRTRGNNSDILGVLMEPDTPGGRKKRSEGSTFDKQYYEDENPTKSDEIDLQKDIPVLLENFAEDADPELGIAQRQASPGPGPDPTTTTEAPEPESDFKVVALTPTLLLSKLKVNRGHNNHSSHERKTLLEDERLHIKYWDPLFRKCRKSNAVCYVFGDDHNCLRVERESCEVLINLEMDKNFDKLTVRMIVEDWLWGGFAFSEDKRMSGDVGFYCIQEGLGDDVIIRPQVHTAHNGYIGNDTGLKNFITIVHAKTQSEAAGIKKYCEFTVPTKFSFHFGPFRPDYISRVDLKDRSKIYWMTIAAGSMISHQTSYHNDKRDIDPRQFSRKMYEDVTRGGSGRITFPYYILVLILTILL